MKVLMFGWEFPPHISGGLGTACYGLTKGLSQDGVEVLFVVPKAYGDENKEAVQLINASDISVDVGNDPYFRDYIKNVTVYGVRSGILPYVSPQQYAQTSTGRGFASQPGDIWSSNYEFSGHYGGNLINEVMRYALIAGQLASKQQFDLIHAHDWLTFPAAAAAKAMSRKPLIVHVHATEFDRSGENVNRDVYEIERKGLEAADKIIAVSDRTKKVLIDKYGIAPAKIQTVHNAVLSNVSSKEQQSELPDKQKKNVTFLGRVTYQKGPDYFLEVAKKVLSKDDQVRFVMAGGGDMLQRMVKRAAELRIASKVHFTGFLKKPEVDKMLGMTDVYVMPSVSEPFGISPLEAMQAGVPVVISKQSGVAEVLKHAIKVDFWDIDATADAIHGLLHYKTLHHLFSKQGKREVDRMQWRDAAHKIKSIYEGVNRVN